MKRNTRAAPQEIAQEEGLFWGNNVAESYFSGAEQDMAAHWSQIIEPIIGDRAYEVVVDLAAGRGRNSALLAEQAKRVICVDINPENIEFSASGFAATPASIFC